MNNYNCVIGRYGEDLAIEYLEKLNHKILDRNFRHGHGEIDIISKTNTNIIVFTEVKSRYSKTYGYPMESVTYSKQKQIIYLSTHYINKTKLHNYNIRFDVIEVILNKINNTFELNHYKDAFRLN